MKKIKKHKEEEFFKIKNQIYKIAPDANDIDIKIDRYDKARFESFIRVHIPPRKNLIAIKKDKSLNVSLEKSCKAIIKQVKKVKGKKKKKKSHRVVIDDPL